MNLLKKFFHKQTGFTLVETLLAIGISTGAAMIVYKVLGESQKGQMMVENRDDINQIHREVIGRLADRATCTLSLTEGMNSNKTDFKVSKIKNDKLQTVINIPQTFGKITLTDLEIKKSDAGKNLAEALASYTHTLGGKTVTVKKAFRLEVSYKDGLFEGCITRGTLALDPKDACDLVVGYDGSGSSYFYNGKCNFAKGACEQSGRVWNEELLKCNFSEDDLESMRQQICETLSQKYDPESDKCLPSDELIKAIEEFQKQMKK